MKSTQDIELTPEQIRNWRNLLVDMIGPYALIAPVEVIQMYRDRMQEQVNQLPDASEGGEAKAG